MAKYVAFLRGINVGGNKRVPMARAKLVMEELGFTNVRTVLASGNIIFDGKKNDLATLTKEIAIKLEKDFGFTIPVIIRSADEIEKIIKSEPFKAIDVTKDTRLYVTFLAEKKDSSLKIPYKSSDNSFNILSLQGNAIFTVLDVSKIRTPDVMAILEKEFGKNITTRNWNTIMKIF